MCEKCNEQISEMLDAFFDNLLKRFNPRTVYGLALGHTAGELRNYVGDDGMKQILQKLIDACETMPKGMVH